MNVAMLLIFGMLLLAAYQLTGGPKLVIYPRIIGVGTEAQLACRIPRSESNRKLVLGIEQITRSERQLEGDRSPSMHLLWVHGIDCSAGAAYCELWNSVRMVDRVTANFVVAGCEP